jgi:hypothetical protein
LLDHKHNLDHQYLSIKNISKISAAHLITNGSAVSESILNSNKMFITYISDSNIFIFALQTLWIIHIGSI